MVKRIVFSLLLLISIFFWPFWISAIIAFLGMLYFSYYFEVVLVFFISDLFFGVKEARFFNIMIISTIISLISLVLIEFLKKKLKFYENK